MHLGGVAVGAAIRRDIAGAHTDRSPASAYWNTVSRGAEMLRHGTDKATAYLGKMAINEDSKGIIFESVQRASAGKAAHHRKNSERLAESADERLDRLETKIGELQTHKRRLSGDERKRFRRLAETHRRKAAEAHASGRYGEATKYMKKARIYQEILVKGRTTGKRPSASTNPKPSGT